MDCLRVSMGDTKEISGSTNHPYLLTLVLAWSPNFGIALVKMAIYLLTKTDLPDGHCIRPRSLKVTTIASVMTEVVIGHANLSRLAIRCNYRDVAPHDVAKIFSRNAAQQRLTASYCAQSDFRRNKGAASLAQGPPIFLESVSAKAVDFFRPRCPWPFCFR